jgi:hypothetical protein
MDPYERQGERNVFCPFYSQCLDIVIEKGWNGWSCSECEHSSRVEKPEIPLCSVAFDGTSTGRRTSPRLPMS